MAVNKLDPKIIFASEAPAQDVPAVFTNKTVGWGESRKNGGRPTIKQSNALQQETDLKILWLNENAVTPYDATIDYPTNAVTIKDGAFKIFNGSVWNIFLTKSSVGLGNVDNTSDLNKPISTATQTSIDLKADLDVVKRGIGNIYDPALTYNKNERVILLNGDTVQSTIPNNTNNPNTNMTGWSIGLPARLVLDASGKNQQDINDEIINVDRFYNGDLSTTLASIKSKMQRPYVLQFGRGVEYTLDKPFELNDFIIGIDLNHCKITYSYEQPIGSTTQTKASLFVQFNRTKPFFMRDGELKYIGNFDTGANYSGMVSGLDIRATSEFSGLYVDNVEASGFNSDGVVINQFQTGWKYITKVAIRNCNLHHNRVAGVRYGFVDGFLLHGNELKYNGLDSDIGTGYGSAGISNTLPKNCVITGNDASFNYRKGIDHHSGYNVIVDNNFCRANKLYGLFITARNNFDGTNHSAGSLSVTNNIVCDMSISQVTNHNEILGIVVGKDTTSIKDDVNTHVTINVLNNIIYNFNSDGLISADAIRILPDFMSCDVNIMGNTLKGGKASYAISFLTTNKLTTPSRITTKISNNTIKFDRLLGYIVRFVADTSVSNLVFSDNFYSGEIGDNSGTLVSFLSQSTISTDVNHSVLYSNNTLVIPNFTVKQDLFQNYGRQNVVSAGNIFNGKAWRDYSQGVYTHSAPNATQDLALTWIKGSVIYNSVPAIGHPASWVCTVTGTGNAVFAPCGIIGNGLVAESVLLTEIQSATSNINTLGKAAGKIIYNRADGKLYTTIGTIATAAWRAVDGSSTITPS